MERVPIKKIKPAAYNPRKRLTPADPEYQKIKRSIEEFGYVGGMVWNRRTGNLVGGHQRLTVLKDLGAGHVDVAVVDLPLDQEKALNLSLNKVAGEWDALKLAELLGELAAAEAIASTGFDEQEAEAAIAEAMAQQAAEKSLDTSPQLAGMEYRIVVDCRNEEHQKLLLARFNKEKLPCRALIS